MKKLMSLLDALFRRRKLDAEMSEEMRLHVEQRTHENLAAGMSPDDARYAALRKFGGVEQAKEIARDGRGWRWLEQALQDLRYAARQLCRAPGFALVAVLTLALGIGATTAIFSLLNALLLRPLPVARPEQLVFLRVAGNDESFSYPAFERFRDQTQTLAAVAAVQHGADKRRMIATGFGATDVEPVRVQGVSGNYFGLLGVPAVLGRPLLPDDDRADAPQAVVVLSHAFWQRRFAGDTDVIGRRIQMDHAALTIVGVAPPGFNGFELGVAPDFWLPVAMLAQAEPESQSPQRLKDEGWSWSLVVGRLRDGVSRAEAQAEIQTIYQRQLMAFAEARAARWTEKQRSNYVKQVIEVVPGGAGFSPLQRQFERPLSVVSVLVGCVLLIACANVAGLLLARGSARQREFAVRAALGAGRGRLARQLVTESLLLAVCGGAAGVALAFAGTCFLSRTLPAATRLIGVDPDGRVLGFALGLSLLTGVLFGLAPALRLSRAAGGVTAKASTGGRSRLNQALVVAQIALSVLLLAGAGLFVRTLQKLKAADLGFAPERVVRFTLEFDRDYNAAARAAVHRRVLEALEALPAVRRATVSGAGVLSGDGFGMRLGIDGYTPQPDEQIRAVIVVAGPRFFETLGIPLRQGREFTAADEPIAASGANPAPRLAVVGESFARRYFGTTNPIGRVLRFGAKADQPLLEIVGVAKDIKYRSLREAAQMEIYVPYFGGVMNVTMVTHVAAVGDPRALEASIRQLVKQIDPRVVVGGLRTLEDLVNSTLAQERLMAQLAGFFGVFALLLASLGLYGLLSYGVVQRTREIGVRMALGARAADVLGLVVGEGVKLALLGTACGIAAALATTRFAEKMLYGVTPGDPITFVGVAALLLVIATIAAWVPARRAAKVDPMVALRAE